MRSWGHLNPNGGCEEPCSSSRWAVLLPLSPSIPRDSHTSSPSGQEKGQLKPAWRLSLQHGFSLSHPEQVLLKSCSHLSTQPCYLPTMCLFSWTFVTETSLTLREP